MSVFSDAAKTGVLSAADVKQYANIPENGAFLAAAVAGGMTRSNIGFVISPGAANVCNVEVRFLNRANNLISGVRTFDIFLSDVATGLGLTAVTASGTVHTKTASGTIMFTYTAKKLLKVATLATGLYTLEITDTAKTGFYVGVVDPVSGLLAVSRQLVTADYG